VGSGAAKLVVLPAEHYKRDRRSLLRGMRKGLSLVVFFVSILWHPYMVVIFMSQILMLLGFSTMKNKRIIQTNETERNQPLFLFHFS
jgi:hypothetical protein